VTIPVNNLDRHVDLFYEFPNRAGRLAQISAATRRLIESLNTRKSWPEEVKKLILASAEIVDELDDTLPWFHAHIQKLADDNDILEHARRKEKLRNQSTIINDLHAERQKTSEAVREAMKAARAIGNEYIFKLLCGAI
jgi:hypothetical protein